MGGTEKSHSSAVIALIGALLLLPFNFTLLHLPLNVLHLILDLSLLHLPILLLEVLVIVFHKVRWWGIDILRI
jgi:hypothetical protein